MGNSDTKVEKIILNLGTDENRRSNLKVRINKMTRTLESTTVKVDNSVVT